MINYPRRPQTKMEDDLKKIKKWKTTPKKNENGKRPQSFLKKYNEDLQKKWKTTSKKIKKNGRWPQLK